MPRLFIKIFLWFWLAMTLIGVILVAIAITSDPRQAFLERQQDRFTNLGNQLIAVYQEKGAEGLAERVLQIHEKEKIRLELVNVKTEHLGSRLEQPSGRDFGRRGGGGMPPPLFRGLRPHFGGRGRAFTLPLNDEYLLLVEMPKASRLEFLLDPHSLTLRLGGTFLVASVICFLLARSITAPIMKLRQAAQEFSRGNLALRVSPSLGQKKGEIFDLANDFDAMAERIETLLQSQRRLLRDISHELRSPLARLNVALELARKDSPKNSAPLNRIEIESERLNELIGQLLTINKLEYQAEITDKKRIDLYELLGRIVADANYEGQGDTIKADLTVRKPAIMEGSQELLLRAIENVVRNALLYTAQDSSIEVSLDISADGSFAEITVTDHGSGVPEEALKDLFRPFYRVGESRDRKSGGTGVGLAIAERAIRLHGGDIFASNSPHGGLVISIHLPLGIPASC